MFIISLLLSTALAQDTIELKHQSCEILAKSIIHAYNVNKRANLKHYIKQYFRVCNYPVEERFVHQPSLKVSNP